MYKPDIHVFISPGKKLVLLLILEVYITIAVHLCMCYPTPLHSNLNIAIWENNKVYEVIYDWAEALFDGFFECTYFSEVSIYHNLSFS